MKTYLNILFSLILVISISSCKQQNKQESSTEAAKITAEDILGNPDYLAMSYGGYRALSRDTVPTVEELQEDMKLLAAMGVKIIRTYNTQQFAQAANLLEAIKGLKEEDPGFEMYVMLGAWIDCEGAWTPSPNHEKEDPVNNTVEIQAAVDLTNAYPDIVKIIAVGNEAMVHWASSYFVQPGVILKWVNHLQELKKTGGLPSSTWITSSDNFAAWGGDDDSYHVEDLTALIKTVDYVSMHTYKFHDTHYNPAYWYVPAEEEGLSDIEKIDAVMLRALEHAMAQYQSTADYIASLGIDKPIHIGETGWATISGGAYGLEGSKAADEYKAKLYYDHMRAWTNAAGMSCFYFEAFDEQWKDALHPMGSENHFGQIDLDGQAKYAIWDLVDQGAFEGLTRGGKEIHKSYDGDISKLKADILPPPPPPQEEK